MMKIIAGMNSIDDYKAFVEAGADEIFCGYVPDWWYEIKGMHVPLNRREVHYSSVQIGSRSDLRILKKMMDHYHVPVTITLNSLSYDPKDYALIRRYINECKEDGFHRFIIADLALLYELKDMKDIVIHISGEAGEVNHLVLDFYAQFPYSRLIFPRHISLEEMSKCIQNKEYEAFILNEKCHYFGGYCNSLHCDELKHMCLVKYQRDIDYPNLINEEAMGATGCGLCALYSIKQMGITHLKLVSRGNYAENTIEDIIFIKRALEIVENSMSEEEYIDHIKKNLFPDGCSGNCYYVIKKT